jgi:predicted glycosyltransferase
MGYKALHGVTYFLRLSCGNVAFTCAAHATSQLTLTFRNLVIKPTSFAKVMELHKAPYIVVQLYGGLMEFEESLSIYVLDENVFKILKFLQQTLSPQSFSQAIYFRLQL